MSSHETLKVLTEIERYLGDGIRHHQQLKTLSISHSLRTKSMLKCPLSNLRQIYGENMLIIIIWVDWLTIGTFTCRAEPERTPCVTIPLKDIKLKYLNRHAPNKSEFKASSPITLFAPASFSMSAACAKCSFFSSLPSESTSQLSSDS